MPRNKYHDTLVVEFHETFGHPVAWKPGVPPIELRILRANLLLEEFLEFVDASGLDLYIDGARFKSSFEAMSFRPANMPVIADIVAAADALADIRYVCDGANLVWGFPGEKILREVHRSNMSKAGPDGKPILREDGKVLKGPDFTPPDIASILDLYAGVDNSGGSHE